MAKKSGAVKRRLKNGSKNENKPTQNDDDGDGRDEKGKKEEEKSEGNATLIKKTLSIEEIKSMFRSSSNTVSEMSEALTHSLADAQVHVNEMASQATSYATQVSENAKVMMKSALHTLKNDERIGKYLMILGSILVLVVAIAVVAGNESMAPLRASINDVVVEGVSFNISDVFYSSSEERPGKILKEKYGDDIKPVHPVIMIPGIVSTGLEVWEGRACMSESMFRQRIWGSTTMVKEIITNLQCWLEHLRLDEESGEDPPGIKLRHARGLQGADEFMAGFWIWSKVIRALADIGYDESWLYMAGFDWRLGPKASEHRDGYFTTLKSNIELQYQLHGEKVVMISHSMGSNVVFYFMKWVQSSKGGNGGDQWLDKYVHSWLNVGGPLLGTSKAVAGLLSGEVKDTTSMGKLENQVIDALMGKGDRARFLRTWTSMNYLFPKGGTPLWGDAHEAPDDITHKCPQLNQSLGPILLIDHEPVLFEKLVDLIGGGKLDSDDPEFEDYPANIWKNQTLKNWSFGAIHPNHPMIAQNDSFIPPDDEEKYWTNPMETPLPNAPNLKIRCMYGVFKDTERQYYYERLENPLEKSIEDAAEACDPSVSQCAVPDPASNRFGVNLTKNNVTCGIDNGVQMADGDGTVNLLSLGYFCATGWKDKILNPHQLPVSLHEYKHEPCSMFRDARGGPKTGDHVDMMGNHEFITDILFDVSGLDDKLEEKVYSQIREISDIAHQRLQASWHEIEKNT